MVNIHQFQPGGAVADAALASEASGQRGQPISARAGHSPEPGSSARAAALAQFQQQWATYRKLVDSDCLSHHELGAILQATLNEVFAAPFTFLDIACGDASMMKAALSGTKVRHYHDIDLSQAALELAAENLAAVPFEVDLDHRDFVEAMLSRDEHADAAWCSLSIHHLATDGKRDLMKAIRGATGARGIFLLYEPTLLADEDRAGFLDRFLRTNKPLWKVLTGPEWDQIWQHVVTCDFPETAAVWCQLGRDAGFRAARQVFVDPTDFFRLFRFEA